MGRPAADLTGKIFGQLVVIERAPVRDGILRWRCRCEACGAQTDVRSGNLRRVGKTKTCGCLRERHGASGTPMYNAWCMMRERCSSPNNCQYQHYGGRGISVCERWGSFAAFVEDMGPRPKGHSIDRIDNDGDYEPGNCRWSTSKEQANNRRSNRCVVFKGKRKTLAQWGDETGINWGTIRTRIDLGWTPHKALTTPVRGSRTIIYRGEEKTLSEWSRCTGIQITTLDKRLKKWPIHKAFTEPVKGQIG